MNRLLAVVAAVAALLAFGVIRGLTSDPEPPAAAASATTLSGSSAPASRGTAAPPTSSSPPPTLATSASTTTPPVVFPEGAPPAAAGDLTAAAAATAEAFVAAWASTSGVTPQQWLDGLAPLTTPRFLDRLATVDLANVPATTVTGPAAVVHVDDQFASVLVPTDSGNVDVALVAVPPVWQVTGLEPPP